MKVDTYLDGQHRHLARFRGKAVNLVEIGVWFGGSLQIWKKYLGRRSHVTGIDIEPFCSQYAEDGIEIAIGDQGDRAWLAEFAQTHPIDILIDDGGHTFAQQSATFDVLFPHIADDGVYICEDTSTSYWAKFGPGSFVDTIKERVDDVNRWFYDEPNDFSRCIASIHFYPSMIVIEKKKMTTPQIARNDGSGLELVDCVPEWVADLRNEHRS